jgi:hypothetical protein
MSSATAGRMHPLPNNLDEDIIQANHERRTPGHLAPIESDGLAILCERGGESISVALVPAIQQLSIARADLHLIRRWRVLRSK